MGKHINHRKRLITRLPVLYVLIIILALSFSHLELGDMSCTLEAAGAQDISKSENTGRGSTYTYERIHAMHGSSLAGGVAYDNFDEDIYQEIVVVEGSSQGRTTLIDFNTATGNFTSNLLWWDPNGALVAVGVGELDNSHQGPEIVVGGFSGNLTILYYDGTIPARNITIWNTSIKNGTETNISVHNDIFGLAIGDITDEFDGNEIAVADANTQFVYIVGYGNNGWANISIPLNDSPRNVIAGEFDMSRPGQELLVLCLNGTVYEVAHEASQWSIIELFKDTDTPFTAVLDDFNGSHPGNEIILTGLSWDTTLIWGSGSSWFNETIWRAPGALEGIAYGDFDHNHDGSELCLTGYSNTAVMLYETETGWYDELIYYDPDPLQTELNGVAITDFYPLNPGSDLLIIGYSGKVRMLTFQQPDFELVVSSSIRTVTAGNFDSMMISIDVVSGYNSNVDLSLSGVPPACTYDFSRSILIPSPEPDSGKDRSVLTIYTSANTPPGTYNLTIFGEGASDILDGKLIRSVNITLNVNDFQLKISPGAIIINLYQVQYAEFDVKIISLNQFNDMVTLRIPETFLSSPEVQGVLEISITPTTVKAGESAVVNVTVIPKLTKDTKFEIPIHGTTSALDTGHTQEMVLSTEYNAPKDDSEAFPMNQYIAVILLVVVFIIIFISMVKRMRDISRASEKRMQEREMQARKGHTGRDYKRRRNY